MEGKHRYPLDYKNLEPIAKSNVEVSRLTRAEKHQDEHDKEEKAYVLKVEVNPIDRENNETDQDYYVRRLEHAKERVEKHVQDQKILREVLSEQAPRVIVPQEHWFIYTGEDGFPSSAAIQEEIKGTLLRNVDVSTLDQPSLSSLVQLLKANSDFYKDRGKMFDLAGKSAKNSPSNFRRVFTGLITASNNIIVDQKGNIALIDLELKEPSSSTFGAIKYARYKLDEKKLKDLIDNDS